MTQYFFGSGEPVTQYVADKLREIDEAKGTAKYYYEGVCSRCGGRGGSEAWAHTGTVCYKCGGSGGKHTLVKTVYTAARVEKLIAARAAKQAAKDAKKLAAAERRRLKWVADHAAEVAAFSEQHSQLILSMQELKSKDDFLRELCSKLDQYGLLSEKQAACAQEIVSRILGAGNSQHVGTVGERVVLTLTTKRMIERPSFYGITYIFKCVDQDGNAITYFGTAAAMPGVGESATVRARIKKHDAYQGEKQTIIERPTAVQELAAA
jgi:hypothetical protein